jgi:hypothetical protein
MQGEDVKAFSKFETKITIEADKIYCSRYINGKLVKLYIALDGTSVDLIAKCDRVSMLNNEVYQMLSGIQVSAEGYSESNEVI